MLEGSTKFSKPAPAASPWYVAAIPTDLSPPALSDLWTVRVCDDLFKVRWQWVPGATGYDLEMSGNHRHSWQRKMTNKNGNGWQFSKWTKNATFWFRVRAVNAHGVSEWRQVKSIAPPCAVTGVQASHVPSADGQSGAITATWQPAHRASGYDVNFSADAGRSWQRMVTDYKGTSYEFTKQIPYNSNYRVAVQARRKGVTSGWTNAPIKTVELTASDIAGTTATLNLSNYSGNWYYKADKTPHNSSCQGPVSGAVENLTGLDAGTTYTYTVYSDSGCASAIKSVSFATPITLTATSTSNTAITLTIAGHNGAWWYKALAGDHVTCQSAGNVRFVNLTFPTAHETHTYTAYKDTDGDGDCDASDELASTGSFTVSVDVLYAGNITATTARLSVTNRTEQWWYQADLAPDTGCTSVAANTASVDLTGLMPGTAYTYKAYNNAGCTTGEIDSTTFTTGGVSVSNVKVSHAGGCVVGFSIGSRSKCASSFRTGSATNGYTLHSVTARFNLTVGSPSGFNVALHAASGNNPASTAISNATLSGDAPASNSVETYTCSGTGCDLSADTTYWIVMLTADTSGSNRAYQWQYVTEEDETKIPSDNGWSIGNDSKHGDNLQNTGDTLALKVAATVNTSVSVSSLGNARNNLQGVGRVNGISTKIGAQFTAGGNTGGYDLNSVTVKIHPTYGRVGTPGDLTVAIYSNGNDNKPGTSQITLSGSNPTDNDKEYTYTCSSGCTLTANGKYHLVLAANSASGTNGYYGWETSSSGSEVAVPSGNGWAIGESFRKQEPNAWSDVASYVKFKVAATVNDP